MLTSIKSTEKTMAVVAINKFLMVGMVVIPVLAIKKILNTDRNFKQCYEPIPFKVVDNGFLSTTPNALGSFLTYFV